MVQKDGVEIGPTDTAASLYFDKLYPLGIEAMVEAVDAVASGSAKPTPQPGEGASFQGLVTDEDARVDWSRPAREIDCLVRGCDPQPGAFGLLADGVPVRLFAGRLRPEASDAEPGTVVAIEGAKLIVAAAGGVIEVGRVRVGDGKKVAAAESSLRPGARLR